MTVPGPRVHHDTAGEHGVHPVSGNTAGESWLLHTLGGADPRGLAIIKQQRTVCSDSCSVLGSTGWILAILEDETIENSYRLC